MMNWIYHSLDERCMSQRRQFAELALRSAMKSGEPIVVIPWPSGISCHACTGVLSRIETRNTTPKVAGNGRTTAPCMSIQLF